MGLLSATFQALLDLLFPPACENCGVVGKAGLCDDCLRRVETLQYPYCMVCGIPFDPNAAAPPQLCEHCRSATPHFDAARAYGLHAGPLRTAIVAYKFKGRMNLADALADLIEHRIRDEMGGETPLPLMDADAVIPLPLHSSRRKWRGFDQAVLLARALGRRLGVQCIEGMLERSKPTAPQIGLTPNERRENVRRAFAVQDPAAVESKRLLLIDDVLTTGATARAAARALKRAGTREVYLLTVSIAPPDWHPLGQRYEESEDSQ
jgi:ComF family protein